MSKSHSGGFHHGNLREALLRLATRELARGRVGEISLRGLATRLGVSRAAPYRHFASKEALLQAVAERGLQELVEAYEKAEALDATPQERLRVACRAYLELARGNPGLFNLLFFTEAYAQPSRKVGPPAPGSGFARFEGLVANARGLVDPAQSRLAALAVWSLIHGFAVLCLQKRVQRFADIDQAEQRVLAMACGV